MYFFLFAWSLIDSLIISQCTIAIKLIIIHYKLQNNKSMDLKSLSMMLHIQLSTQEIQ